MSGRVENLRRNRIVRRIVLGIALLTPAFASATPCDLRRNEDGTWSGNCSLSKFFKEFRLEMEIFRSEPRYQLKLPNLHPRKLKYYVVGQSVEAYVDGANAGDFSSRPVDVAVMFTITDPRNNHAQVQFQNATAIAPAIQARTEQRIYLTTFALPSNQQDWDVTAIAVVDPPTPASPIWGALMETDELDNSIMTTCRVYGPDPDTSVSPCN